MSFEREIYGDRPGFSYPYEGPTQPEGDEPDGWSEMSNDERLYRLIHGTDNSDALEARNPDSGGIFDES